MNRQTNSSKLLALGLVLFLGACASTEGAFLDKVKDKYVYDDKDTTSELGYFSFDGEEYIAGGGVLIFTFVSNDGDIGTYTLSVTSLEFTTKDGLTGMMKSTNRDEQKVWFESEKRS